MKKIVSNQETNLINIAKNAGLGIGGRLFFLLVRFCIALLVARTLGPEQYGIYVLAMGIIAFPVAFSLLGLEPAMVRFVAQYKAQKESAKLRGTIAFGCEVVLISSLVLGLGLFMSAEWMSEVIFHKMSLIPLLRVMALAVPFSSVMVILLSALQGAKMVKYKILVEQMFMPMSRLILVIVAFWLGFQILGVVWAWAITTIAGFLLAVFFMLRRIGPLFSESRIVEKKTIISFSAPLFLSRFFYQNRKMIGIIILGGFYPAVQIGIYGVAMRALPFILIPLFAFNIVFSPIISDLFTRGKLDELARVYKTGSKWVITATLPIFILIVFFSKEIMTIFGSGFAESAKIMIILLTGQMVNVATGSAAIMLSMTGKPLYNLFNSVTLFVVSIVLTILMIQKFGPIGAAYAYSLSIIFVQLLQTGEVWYLYKIHPYMIEHIKPVLCSISSFLVIYFLEGFFSTANPLISIIGLVIIFLSSYVIFLILAGLSIDDRIIMEKIFYKILRKPVALTE